VTALAPLPGRATEPDGEGDAGTGGHEVVVLPDTEDTSTTSGHSTISVDSGNRATEIDLTHHRPRPLNDPAAQAAWVFGVALAMLSEGTAERVVMAEVLAEAAGRSRALEGAYGRAVALLSEFPGDPLVHRTVDLLAKALLRSRRPARAAEEA
jgi:hypothetical protein